VKSGNYPPQKPPASPELSSGGNGELDAWREPVRRQLSSILASSAFRNSKRYCTLLTYLVERTLDGQASELKERNIGVDVFERPPDYSTATDHVVRSAAGEIRKRLAQYYIEWGTTAEVRVDLPLGSYVPRFRLRCDELQETANAMPAAVVNPEIDKVWPKPRSSVRWLALLAAFSASVVTLGATLWVTHESRTTALERFWAPVTAPPTPVLLCIGRTLGPPARKGVAGQNPLAGSPTDALRPPMGTEDAIALARIAGALQAAGKAFRVLMTEHDTTFDDLRQGPAVLIGAINNAWVLRLTNALRFRFGGAAGDAEPFIWDSETSSPRSWHSIRSAASGRMTRDYAIVARCRNPETGQIIVVAAGSHPWGTRAAGEFLINPVWLKDLEALAQKNGNRKNMQVVLATDIVQGATGPPSIVAAHFW
jgi:hypothetical protein